MASIEIITNAWPVRDVLPLLLTDRSAKKNIIFATDSYADRGEGYGAKNQITEQALNVAGRCIIQPRVLKNSDEQLLRTRKKAEVFTPAWVCCLMNNHIDEEWFGRPDVFGKLTGQDWTPSEEPVQLPKRRRWQTYIDSRRLEITCGEAPYLVSRYDMATGEIIPIKDRIGILDRKLRIVGENAATEEEWLKWSFRAFQSVYGYEYQGDNLLIARINLLLTYIDYMQDRWDRKPTSKELQEVAKVISWNIWQMDGLKGSIPLGALYEEYHQLTIFDIFGMDAGGKEEEPEEYIPCRIYDWRGQNKSIEFNAFREGRNGSMKFDFIIGNPPYQDDYVGSNNQAKPVYNLFMDNAYEIGDIVELITPARFLTQAGATPKDWNKKMLNDEHFKVLHYEEDSSKVFSGVDIKGGVVVSYHSQKDTFEPIEVFVKSDELRMVFDRVKGHLKNNIGNLVHSPDSFRFTDVLFEENPDLIGRTDKQHAKAVASSVFERYPEIFHENGYEGDVKVIGRKKNERVTFFAKAVYFNDQGNLHKWKVLMAGAIGSGTFGESLSEPIIAEPESAHTQTFVSMGEFDTEYQANSLASYLKTKFARALLGIMKTTQNNQSKVTWSKIPLQDFTPASDIDWSQSVAGIDRQLYAKYGLSDEEIAFIETHVKEME